MCIQVGDQLPEGRFWESESFDEQTGCPLAPTTIILDKIYMTGNIIIVGVPGAFTPTCHAKHISGYIEKHKSFSSLLIDEIICIAVNDPFVMATWRKELQVPDNKIQHKPFSPPPTLRFLSDGNGEWTKNIGLELDLSSRGMGIRSQRYSMLVHCGKILTLNVEPDPRQVTVSGVETILEQAKKEIYR